MPVRVRAVRGRFSKFSQSLASALDLGQTLDNHSYKPITVTLLHLNQPSFTHHFGSPIEVGEGRVSLAPEEKSGIDFLKNTESLKFKCAVF